MLFTLFSGDCPMNASSRDILIGRQSILDRNSQIFAYELLFRSSRQTNEAQVLDDTLATASVIVDTLMEVGVTRVLGGKKGFVNIGHDFLLSDAIFLLPGEHLVLEILETVPVTPETIARCRELKSRGYTLALDDYIGDQEMWAPILDQVSIVKVDILGVGDSEIEAVTKKLAPWKIRLLAEKVETHAQLLKTMALGFSYFQGFFFARPVMLSGKKTDPVRQALTGILSLVLSDAETEEIIKAIRPHLDLVSSLLRVANVVGLSPGRTVTDLRQAILVMGREQLKRWLELLLFSASSSQNRYARPLFLLAIVRGRLMETLAPLWQGGNRPNPDHAFLTGLFSLAEPLMEIPLQELLEGLPLDSGIKDALQGSKGPLGTLLAVARHLVPASPEEESLPGSLLALPLPPEALARVQTEAQIWADETIRAFA